MCKAPQMNKAEIKMHNITAGWLNRDEEGYQFRYDAAYLHSEMKEPVSLTLPLQEMAFTSKELFPFFDGLIPEGWLLDVALKSWNLTEKDRIGLLIACCKDCIGAVSVHPVNEEDLL